MQSSTQSFGFLRSQQGGVKLIILFLFLGIIVLGIGGTAGIWFGIPKKIGLGGGNADTVLAGAPDRAAAQQVTQAFQAAGYSTTGTELYMVPVAGTTESMAILVLDESQGFTFTRSGTGDPVKDFANALANAQDVNVKRAAIVYRGADGEEVATVTSSMDDLKAYAQGSMTPQQLGAKLDVSYTPSKVLTVLQEQGVISR